MRGVIALGLLGLTVSACAGVPSTENTMAGGPPTPHLHAHEAAVQAALPAWKADGVTGLALAVQP